LRDFKSMIFLRFLKKRPFRPLAAQFVGADSASPAFACPAPPAGLAGDVRPELVG
jgi:hypothetical protein